jgi:hypothetical protein
MSPFQFDVAATSGSNTPIDEADWDGIGCIVCHDPHSSKIAFFNGTEREEPAKDYSDVCGACHQGSQYSRFEEWSESAHANSYHDDPGHSNANAYCAKCMSPYQYDESATSGNQDSYPITEENWSGIGCAVCHHPHSLEFRVFNGTGWEDPVDNPADLCGSCHTGSRHPQYPDWSESTHSTSLELAADNNNTFCAKCHSPHESDPDATFSDYKGIAEKDWTGINCIVCHNPHSLELSFYNGSDYEDVNDDPIELCTKCHKGSGDFEAEPHAANLAQAWQNSAHADTFKGYNNNSYCAHCMSPYQGDPTAAHDNNEPVSEENWTGVTCIVCHDQHSLELAFYNGSGREDSVTNPAELCGSCHTGSRHPQYPDWSESTHSTSLELTEENNNTFCAKCHSPHESDPDATLSNNTGIIEDDWTGINCIVCHDPHTLDLVFWNGASYEDIADDPVELCSKCHKGSEDFETEPHAPNIVAQWESSGHSNTYNVDNDNTYCAHCMSPLQAGPEIDWSEDTPVGEGQWGSIGCTVCHNKHSLEISLYNGSAYVDIPVSNNGIPETNKLCGSCHTMGDATIYDEPKYPQLEMRAGTGGFGVSDSLFKPTVQCAGCHGYQNNHTFEFNIASCSAVDCHAGAKTNESAQLEVDEWHSDTEELLDAVKLNLTKVELVMNSAKKAGTWNDTLNVSYYTALFNYKMVEEDGSHGTHNPTYADKLLKYADDELKVILDMVEFLPSISHTPVADAKDVPIDTDITITFDNDINFTTLLANNYLTINGEVTGITTYNNAKFTVVFDPFENLAYNTTYMVTLSENITFDSGGKVLLEDYSWSFTTMEPDITEVIITIGPIVDESDQPIENAKVTVIINGNEFSNFTDQYGNANISIPIADFIAGAIDVGVEKDGYDDLSFDGTVDSDGDFTGAIPDMKKTEKKEEEDYTMIIVAIIIIIIIIIVFMILASRSRAAPEEEEVEEEKVEQRELMEDEEEEFECPECGADVVVGEIECPECGAEIEEEIPEEEIPEEEEPEEEEPEEEEPEEEEPEEEVPEEEVPEEEAPEEEAPEEEAPEEEAPEEEVPEEEVPEEEVPEEEMPEEEMPEDVVPEEVEPEEVEPKEEAPEEEAPEEEVPEEEVPEEVEPEEVEPEEDEYEEEFEEEFEEDVPEEEKEKAEE